MCSQEIDGLEPKTRCQAFACCGLFLIVAMAVAIGMGHLLQLLVTQELTRHFRALLLRSSCEGLLEVSSSQAT